MNSVGDYLAVTRIAWTLYNGYKDAPGDFKNLSDEIKSLHNIVSSDILTAKFRDPNLPSEEKGRLREILQGCTNVLKDLDNLLTKYKRLRSPQGSGLRNLDRVRWCQEDIVELRARLTSNTTLLNTFVASCSHEQIMNSQAEMQRAMGEMQTTLRRGLRRKNSTSSLHSIASFTASITSKETWKGLCRDLHQAGVTPGMIRERKDRVIDFFQGSSPPMVIEEIPECKAPGTSTRTSIKGSDVPPNEAEAEKEKRNTSLKINSAPLDPFTGPLLIAAVKSGDTNAVRSRLTVGGNLDINGYMYTALYWAATQGHTEIVQLLLETGANTQAARNTALGISAGNGDREIVKLLLDNGANTEAARNTGETALYTSACNGHFEVVKLLLEKGANTEANRYIGTALYASAFNGHLEVVKLLLEKGANIEAASGSGATALYASARNGHLEVVKLLLDKGANTEAARNTGETALYASAYNGHFEVAKLLLDNGANTEAARNTGTTALYISAYNGHLKIVKLLLDKGANTEAALDTGETALGISAQNGHREIVKLLLDNGANLEAARNTGETALYASAYNGHFEVVKLLLKKGAVLQARTNQGETAVDVAVKRGHNAVVNLLTPSRFG